MVVSLIVRFHCGGVLNSEVQLDVPLFFIVRKILVVV